MSGDGFASPRQRSPGSGSCGIAMGEMVREVAEVPPESGSELPRDPGSVHARQATAGRCPEPRRSHDRRPLRVAVLGLLPRKNPGVADQAEGSATPRASATRHSARSRATRRHEPRPASGATPRARPAPLGRPRPRATAPRPAPLPGHSKAPGPQDRAPRVVRGSWRGTPWCAPGSGS